MTEQGAVRVREGGFEGVIEWGAVRTEVGVHSCGVFPRPLNIRPSPPAGPG